MARTATISATGAGLVGSPAALHSIRPVPGKKLAKSNSIPARSLPTVIRFSVSLGIPNHWDHAL